MPQPEGGARSTREAVSGSTRLRAAFWLLRCGMSPLVMRVWLPLMVVALLGGTALGQVGWSEVLREGSVEDVRAALDAGADVNARDFDGQTALMSAAFGNENPEVAAALLDAGADVNARALDGQTALMRAAQYNPTRHFQNPEVVLVLLDYGADATLADSRGRRAIDHARENRRLEGTSAYWRLHDASFD